MHDSFAPHISRKDSCLRSTKADIGRSASKPLLQDTLFLAPCRRQIRTERRRSIDLVCIYLWPRTLSCRPIERRQRLLATALRSMSDPEARAAMAAADWEISPPHHFPRAASSSCYLQSEHATAPPARADGLTGIDKYLFQLLIVADKRFESVKRRML